MAPGVYKSFRKAWDKNIDKYNSFVNDYNNPLQLVTYRLLSEVKTSEELTDEVIESMLGFNFDNTHTLLYKKGDDYSLSVISELKRICYKLCMCTITDIEREVYQAMEAFVHNLNTLHARAGSQLPFSSVNLGTDTSNAGRLVTKNLLLAMEAGLGHGETCIFPIVIFKVKEGVNYNPKDKNYDLFKLSFRVTGKRLFPNYIFLDSPFNLQYYKPGHPETECATMGK